MERPDPVRQPMRAGVPRLFSGLLIVASSTLVSRVLGMFREVASARLFGLGPVWDAFSFAFTIPNLARRLFGEGALSAAFLPVFARELERGPNGNHDSAWRLASAVFSLLATVLSGLVLIVEIILWGISAAFTGHADIQLLVGLTAVMLPYAVLICLAAQVTAVLNAVGHFTWPALVPVVLNLCWIGTIWLVDPWFEPDRIAQVYALAVCIVVAGVLQLALQWPTLKRFGFRFRLGWRHAWPQVQEILRAVVPVTLGLSITQINSVLDRLIAWSLSQPLGSEALLIGQIPYPLSTGAISALYFGERVYQFPLGVFGVALGTVLFPMLARHSARADLCSERDDLTLGLRLVLMIGLPASAGLMLLARPTTSVLFEHGQFSAEDASRTAGILAAYGAGVWAYCGIPVLYRGFYALGNRTLPVRIGLCAVALDSVLNLCLIWPLAERGLALSTALSATFQVVCLSWFIQRLVGRLDWRQLGMTALRAGGATAAMWGVCLGAQRLFPAGSGTFSQAVSLAVTMVLGILTYAGVGALLGLTELWRRCRQNGLPGA